MAALALVAGLGWANIRWSAIAPGGGSFFATWAGARAYLLQQQDPYGSETASVAQNLAYGRQVPTGSSPYRLDLPFFLLPIFFPFALASDPGVARGLWALLAQMAIGAVVLVCLRTIEWRATPVFVLVFSLLVAFSFYSILALMEGTAVVFLALAYVGILWAMATGNDELAGALAVLCLCFWEVGILFLVLVTWRVFHERRWRMAAGFIMTLVILMAVAFLLYPGWPLPFLTASIAMLRSEHGITTSAVFTRLVPQYGMRIAQALTILLLSTLVYEWAVARDSDSHRFTWVTCLALTATPLLGFRTETANLVVLFPSLVLVAAAALRRRKSGAWLGILLLALAFVVPWILYLELGTSDPRLFQDVLFLFLPGVSLLGMYWTRWWFLRPARTWLDEVRATRQ